MSVLSLLSKATSLPYAAPNFLLSKLGLPNYTDPSTMLFNGLQGKNVGHSYLDNIKLGGMAALGYFGGGAIMNAFGAGAAADLPSGVPTGVMQVPGLGTLPSFGSGATGAASATSTGVGAGAGAGPGAVYGPGGAATGANPVGQAATNGTTARTMNPILKSFMDTGFQRFWNPPRQPGVNFTPPSFTHNGMASRGYLPNLGGY